MEEQRESNKRTVKQFEEELKTLLEKYGIVLGAEIVFPQYAILPDEVKLAQLIFNRHGAVIRSQYAMKGENSNANTI